MSSVADTKVARRYAGALFAASQQLGKLDAVQRDLDNLVSLWDQTPALRQMMESPLIPGERKKSLVAQMFARDLDPMTLSFLDLLVDKRREVILAAVRDEFRLRADAAMNLVRAEAVSAVPLDTQQQAGLVAGLQKRTGKHVELKVAVDPNILGGVVVRMQDTVIDGSVRGALERLREQMLQQR